MPNAAALTVPAATDLPRRIHDLLVPLLADRPDDLAYIDHDGRCCTWAEFDRAVTIVAGWLAARGVRAGDRVLILNENCLALAACIMAASRLDAWAVVVNARLSAGEVERIAAHCTPRVIACTVAASPDAARHAERLGATAESHSRVGTLALAGPLGAEPEPAEESNARQVAAMIYTSGTTGEPKGVMLSHANLLWVATVSGGLRHLGREDFLYAVLPVAHVFGLTSSFLAALRAGAMLQFVPRFDPAHLAEALAGGITVFQGVPAMYARLLEYLDARGAPLKAPRLRYMSSGGAPLDIAWKQRIEARFGVMLHNGYGLTEAAPTVTQTLPERPAADDTIGPALPGLEVRLVTPEGADVPEGEIGELWVRGPSIMLGYYHAPAATAAAITPDGFLRTGDLARRNAQGDYYLVGRSKELIIRSGFNVYPPEVEAALNTHPAVVMSAVVGRRVSGNEEVIAFVEALPGSGLTAAALEAHLVDRLAPYKRPQHLFIVERMPAAATGKVKKHELLPLAESLIAERGVA